MRSLIVYALGVCLVWVGYFFGHRDGDQTGWTAGYSSGHDVGVEDGKVHGFERGYVSCQSDHACPLAHRYSPEDMRAICYTEIGGKPVGQE